MNKAAKNQSVDSCKRVEGKKNFIGCLRKVRFNERDILYAVKEKLHHGSDMFGKVVFACSRSNVGTMLGLNDENSHLRVSSNILQRNRTSYELVMRTFESWGHVMTHKAEGEHLYITQIL